MGWTFTHREKGITHKDWFTREFSGEHNEVLDVASGSLNRNNVYVAMRRIDQGYVFGVAIMTCWRPNDPYNFGQKEMGESMGPNICDMPERIYKLLSPLEEVYPGADFDADSGPRWAKEWRERIEAHHERMRNRIKLSNGLQVKAPYDLHFGHSILRAGEPFVVANPKRRLFGRNGWEFRLRKETVYDLEPA